MPSFLLSFEDLYLFNKTALVSTLIPRAGGRGKQPPNGLTVTSLSPLLIHSPVCGLHGLSKMHM